MSDAPDPDPSARPRNPPEETSACGRADALTAVTKPLAESSGSASTSTSASATTSSTPTKTPTPTLTSAASAPAATTAHRPPSLVSSTRPPAIDLSDDTMRSAPPPIGGTSMSPSRSAPLISPRTGRMRSPAPRSTPRSPSSPSFPSPGDCASSGGGGRARPASVLVASLSSSAVPIKPRSNSSLTSSRPAPPSPAGSRPHSQILDGPLSPTFYSLGGVTSPIGGMASSPKSPSAMRGSPSPSGAGRDRAPSTSSTTSRRIRPRSTLGTSVTSAAMCESGQLAAVTEPDGSPSDAHPPMGGLARAADKPARADTPEKEDKAEDSADRPSPIATAVVVSGASAAAGGSPAFVEGLIRRVIVRDFAFSPEDERFFGLGRQRPRSNWGEGEPEPDVPEPRSSGGGFGFGNLSLGGLGLGSFGFLRRETDAEVPEEDGRVEDLGNAHDTDGYWSDEYDDDDDDEEEEEDDGEEPDGLYRVAYAFEPEGMNEMAVDVGDLLDVRGRGGGGDGWVVAIRLDSGAEGLVPEGYLERAPEDAHPEEWARVRDVRAKLATVGLPGQNDTTPSDARRLSAGAVGTASTASSLHTPGSAP